MVTARILQDSYLCESVDMRGSAFLLIILPPYILWALFPALVASTFPAIIKGGFIGLYCAISIIGGLKMRESFRAS